jgi:hypothetical protein
MNRARGRCGRPQSRRIFWRSRGVVFTARAAGQPIQLLTKRRLLMHGAGEYFDSYVAFAGVAWLPAHLAAEVSTWIDRLATAGIYEILRVAAWRHQPEHRTARTAAAKDFPPALFVNLASWREVAIHSAVTLNVADPKEHCAPAELKNGKSYVTHSSQGSGDVFLKLAPSKNASAPMSPVTSPPGR